MLERASGQFTIEGNVEDIFGGISGATRIARISQTCRFTGALEGEGIAEYTAVLPREGDGSFQGFQRMSGTLGEREGTFVVNVVGTYVKGSPRGTWTIVPKSGSGDFVHIRGGGAFSQPSHKPGTYTFEFDVRKPRKARDAKVAIAADARELVPGIDVASEDESIPVIEAVTVSAPMAETPIAKPVRRPRTKTAPVVVEPLVATVEPEAAPKRARKKAAVASDQVVPTSQIAEEAPPAKRTRRPASPVVEGEAVVLPALPAKPRRKRTETPAASVAPAPAAEAPRKRARKTPTGETPAHVSAAEIPVAATPPGRAKKTTPAPVSLPVAESKPARPRKAKAA